MRPAWSCLSQNTQILYLIYCLCHYGKYMCVYFMCLYWFTYAFGAEVSFLGFGLD